TRCPPGAGESDRRPRLGAAGAPAHAAQPRRNLPAPHDGGNRGGGRCGGQRMSNIIAIAHKELKSYFASPIAYIVLGFAAILFGWFFVNLLYYFDRMSLQAGTGFGGPESVNVNEMLISPLFLNVGVILLFTLPLVTMRTYAEEKRTGTIELLLTAPLTDFQIVMGKFLGGFVLYAAMV